jgi:hypothetical protein
LSSIIGSLAIAAGGSGIIFLDAQDVRHIIPYDKIQSRIGDLPPGTTQQRKAIVRGKPTPPSGDLGLSDGPDPTSTSQAHLTSKAHSGPPRRLHAYIRTPKLPPLTYDRGDRMERAYPPEWDLPAYGKTLEDKMNRGSVTRSGEWNDRDTPDTHRVITAKILCPRCRTVAEMTRETNKDGRPLFRCPSCSWKDVAPR